MTTISNWLLGLLVILAGYGVSLLLIAAWITIDDWNAKRKRKRTQDIEYKELYDGVMAELAEIERALQED